MVFGAKLRCLLTKAYRDGAGGTVTEGGYNWLTPGVSPTRPATSDLQMCPMPSACSWWLPVSFINITLFYYLAPLFTNIREEWNSCQGGKSNSKSPLRIIARGSSETTLLAAFRLSRHTRTLPWRPAAPLGTRSPAGIPKFPLFSIPPIFHNFLYCPFQVNYFPVLPGHQCNDGERMPRKVQQETVIELKRHGWLRITQSG